jgi:2-C-methyl-D-erythritol 4-phosphate cytidylyltransferase
MIEWSIDALRACDSVGAIVVAVPPAHEEELAGRLGGGGEAVDGEGPAEAGTPELVAVAGGATRAQSVANALAAVETELVAIHDAARPLLTPELVEALVADLEANPDAAGVIAAAPVADTLKRAAEPTESPGEESRTAFTLSTRANAVLTIDETVNRAGLWAAQTPQVFRTGALREALDVEPERRDAATDEAMLVEAAGGTVLLRHCRGENLKVTTPQDLRLAELLLRDRGR